MPITDPWFYLAAVPAVLLAGISKGGFGGGLGVMAVPLMALFVSPVQAAAIMLPILCLMDIFGLRAYRNTWDRRNIAIMVPGALVGILIGTLTFRYLNDGMIRLLIGTIAIGFTLHHFARRVSLRPARPSRLVGGLASALAGFTSFVAHAGGPPVQFFLLPQRMDKTLYVGTTVVFFFVINYVKLVPYGWLGQFSPDNLLTALILAPLAPLGIWLGVRLHGPVGHELFYRLCYGMLLVTGVKLLWDGLWPLLT
ncbi:MAG: sulfite exporter TauE/SafE family protein [Rhodospirillales bacterium]|nr:sulfite exporter TauE/SafE family protein [Rhodospirillales bacterium]MDH3790249.1 sulfite exporter TauE/SafE family protein [Rhodospirillales bacterium]MDH3909923.1 sulfite exporter TauE/SafE family protein [Rhodospirillales bacterium]MDH3917780.1 sulfite exporter TauE/SafE family protein [Rhodospirillales bacterium]MDH3967001.1 sulfite exporter TauE/SafE family protein [Rhodospirillales bacterium]